MSFHHIRHEMTQMEENLRGNWSPERLWEPLSYQNNQPQDIKILDELTLISLFVSSLATTWWRRGYNSLGIEQESPVYFSRASFERDKLIDRLSKLNRNQNLTISCRDKYIKYYFWSFITLSSETVTAGDFYVLFAFFILFIVQSVLINPETLFQTLKRTSY